MNYKQIVSSVLPLVLIQSMLTVAQSNNFDLITGDCLQVASQRECSLFVKCCDVKCQQQVGYSSRQHFCMSLLGQIITEKTECVCNAATSSYKTQHPSSKFGIPKMDLVGGVILIFVLDFVLLTFTL